MPLLARLAMTDEVLTAKIAAAAETCWATAMIATTAVLVAMVTMVAVVTATVEVASAHWASDG